MGRIKFRKGEQRKFLNKVLVLIKSPSLRELGNRLDISYSTLKNYYSESRLLPEAFFRDLCYLAKINLNNLKFEILDEFFGQSIGGKKSRK